MIRFVLLVLLITLTSCVSQIPVDDASMDDEPSGEDEAFDRIISDAPLRPADLRVVVVSQDGSGEYGRIQDALDEAQPGDTIMVKNGTYVESIRFRIDGTRDRPIALVAHPGHDPVINPGGGSYPADTNARVQLDANWIIIDGFEITYGWDGIRVNEGHNTIRNNWIHHNENQGILTVWFGVDDLLIENNLIEYNGYETCARSSGEISPRHCHGIYFSRARNCDVPMVNVTVRNNTLTNHGGAGIQWNGYECEAGFERFVVEDNRFIDNSRALTLYHNVRDVTIRNNTVSFDSYPETNANPHTIILFWGDNTGNVFEYNTFRSSLDEMLAIHVRGEQPETKNLFDHNQWDVASDKWDWNEPTRTGFASSFRAETGWEENGEIV